ncbi:helix-turn-helix transcriptional regulator [Burkholderia plantarii]|uniref:AraC family transcriptional regulator n=1 Tax=Burkholderia plantarii TaxID=41899 RepID=UPI00272BAD00|nr:helix-turn-helix transcriptional regulator [Burkholderia plantarii]WLE62695.1 helix-turn-helix transcriptional regulator [Burkholderia plantarii]
MSHLNFDANARDSSAGPVVFVVAGRGEDEHATEPHQHARGQLFGSLRGLLTVELDEGVWVVPAIHAVWIPPHYKHGGKTHGPFHGWSAYIAEAACGSLPKQPCALRTSGLLREAVLRASQWPIAALDEQKTHVAEVILDEIRTLPIEPLGLPFPRDPRLHRIARALIANPADNRDLKRWATWASVSSRTLSRRFVAETGFNFTAWRQRARLMRSLEMLAAGMPVTAIALDLGYSTASAYITLFRRTFAETPAAYRLRLQS